MSYISELLVVVFPHWVSTGFNPSWWIWIIPSGFEFSLLYHHCITLRLMIMRVMLCWPIFVSWMFNFIMIVWSLYWISYSFFKLFSHWVSTRSLKILSFAKLNMVSEHVFRSTSILENFHWCTKRNWVPHNSWYLWLDPSGFYLEKSRHVWSTLIMCTCWSREWLNWLDLELKCFCR